MENHYVVGEYINIGDYVMLGADHKLYRCTQGSLPFFQTPNALREGELIFFKEFQGNITLKIGTQAGDVRNVVVLPQRECGCACHTERDATFCVSCIEKHPIYKKEPEDFNELEKRVGLSSKIPAMADETYVKSVAVPDEMLCPIERPVYYNKFSQYICDKNDVPLAEVFGEDDRVGQFISEAINKEF